VGFIFAHARIYLCSVNPIAPHHPILLTPLAHQPNYLSAMSTPVYISPRVIDTVTSLPVEDRIPISNALSMEFILGIDPADTLTPMQGMLYAMIKFYVTQDTERNRAATSSADPSSFEPYRCALG
jgi:hypothetical protein